MLTDLVLRHGFSDQWLVHYSGRQVWGSRDGVLYTAMFPSLAGTYFASRKSPSIYLSGSLGVGGAGDLTIEGGRGDVSGVAGFIGLGYEFARHIGLEAVGGLLNTDNDHVYGTAGVVLKAIAY